MLLDPGTNLAGRFAIVGVLGTGGTASVYLAVDQLRGEKVALKVVHGHLASDAKVRRRIQREVRASSLLRHEAALVPWDLHELDGHLALSMPYHPGRTLSERVSAEGALPIEEARGLGIRVASALAEAHRCGLLHLDVTPNNVLVDGGMKPMLTDFGLSRAQTDATRSTSIMGTAGFMAPERMAKDGKHPLPATDLYGLGCVLYLALTGINPFPTNNPMAALQAQLGESFTPVRELRKDCPPELAEIVHALLRKDPERRPAGARMVVSALNGDVPLKVLGPSRGPRTAHLEPGIYAVVVKERDEDSARRRQLRIDAKKAPNTIDAAVSKRARELIKGVLTYVGINRDDDVPPEFLLVQAIADEAQLDPTHLSQPLVLVQKRFILADEVSRAAGTRIAADARSAGFRAEVVRHKADAHDHAFYLRTALTMGWIFFALSWATPFRPFSFYFLFVMIAASTLIGRQLKRPGRNLSKLPVAYGNRLNRWLSNKVAGRYSLKAAADEAEPVPEEPQSRGEALLTRVGGELDALLRTIEQLDLNTVATSDLRGIAKALRERAEQLAEQLDRLEVELGKPAEDTHWMEARLDRLRTKTRAGEHVEPEEISRLEATLEASREAEDLRERLESQHLAAVAGLLEIGSTATMVRRNLLANPEPHTAAQAVHDLRREAQALERARRELS